jgi:hypothetical protein
VQHRQEAATQKQVDWFRKMAQALVREQELLGWHTRTRGERSIIESTYAGREQYLSRKALAMLDAYLQKLTGRASQSERREVEYLRDFLAMEYIGRKTASLIDKLHDLASRAKVKLPWSQNPVSFRELMVLLSQTKNPDKRKRIQKARAEVYAKTLNPVYLAKANKEHELAQWMGYPSYFKLSEQVRRADIRKLLLKGNAFKSATDDFFSALMKKVVQETLKKKLTEMKRSDHLRLMRAPKVEKFFPRQLMLPAFEYFLASIGLDLKTASGDRITIDDAMHPQKNPRAACFPIEVPADIRITVKPKGGLESWATLFHEGGHALHFAWTKEKRFAFKQLGNNTVTEAFAELFARIWAEPAWLEHYTRFVRNRNRRPPKPSAVRQKLEQDPHYIIARRIGMILPRRNLRPRRVPLMRKADQRYVIRHRLAWDMYLYRRYGWAKLIYESSLHGADQQVWQGVFGGDISDRRKLYGKLFSEAYGYTLDPVDTAGYLADVDPFFYAADYARAFMGADMLIEHLRRKFGKRWFTKKAVGAYLKTLWAKGKRWSGAELARQLGYENLTYAASEARVKRLGVAAGLKVRTQASGSRTRPRARTRTRTRTRSRTRTRPHARTRPRSRSRARGRKGNKDPCPGGAKPDKRGMCPIPLPR